VTIVALRQLRARGNQRKRESGACTITQQQKAKMPAAGATQALRLFCNTLVAICPALKDRRCARRKKKMQEEVNGRRLGAEEMIEKN